MNQLYLVGRIILGGYFLFSASHHFTQLDQMAALTAAHHVPLPGVAVVGAGVLLAIAGVSFLLGLVPKIGIGALVLFLVPVTVIMHAFWADADPQQRMNDLINFTKNCALLGSGLMFLAIPEPWPYSVHVPAARHAHAPA